MKLTRRQIVALELGSVLLLHLGEVAVRYPGNHVARFYFPYLAVLSAIVLYEAVRQIVRRECCWFFWRGVALILPLPIVENRLNVVTSYMEWVERDMPAWGHPAGWTEWDRPIGQVFKTAYDGAFGFDFD